MIFNPSHSPLEENKKALKSYVDFLEKKLGDGSKVVGIVEFGSYAKEEAVSYSDIDTRVYVTCPSHYIWQPAIGRFRQHQRNELEKRFLNFKKTRSALPHKEYDWWTFNNTLAEEISSVLGVNIEFGLSDYRYSVFELQHLDRWPAQEHAILLQSNILYDPQGSIALMRENIKGKKFNPLCSFYQKRYLDALPFEIYQHLKSEKHDNFKIEKSKQIQWVKWAVRCLRDAVASKSYIASGDFIFKKDEVLRFYKHYLPDDYELIQQIYSWKTNEQVRKKMVNDFLNNKEHYFQLFTSLTPKLESIVEKINYVA